jgi:hypothetical protein
MAFDASRPPVAMAPAWINLRLVRLFFISLSSCFLIENELLLFCLKLSVIEHDSKSKIKSSIITNKVFMNLSTSIIILLVVADEDQPAGSVILHNKGNSLYI